MPMLRAAIAQPDAMLIRGLTIALPITLKFFKAQEAGAEWQF